MSPGDEGARARPREGTGSGGAGRVERRKASVTSTARGGADYAGGRRSGSGGYFYILADGEGNDPFLVHRAPSVSSSSSQSNNRSNIVPLDRPPGVIRLTSVFRLALSAG